MSDKRNPGGAGQASRRPNTGEYSRTDIASITLLFNRLSSVEDRLASVERTSEMTMNGQGRLSEQFIEQRIALGRIEATLEHLRGDIARHDKEIVEVETQAHRMEVSTAEKEGRRGALFGVLKSVWAGKQYWLLPILAALAGYLSTKF